MPRDARTMLERDEAWQRSDTLAWEHSERMLLKKQMLAQATVHCEQVICQLNLKRRQVDRGATTRETVQEGGSTWME